MKIIKNLKKFKILLKKEKKKKKDTMMNQIQTQKIALTNLANLIR